jgi:hypothetical protein
MAKKWAKTFYLSLTSEGVIMAMEIKILISNLLLRACLTKILHTKKEHTHYKFLIKEKYLREFFENTILSIEFYCFFQ